MGFKFPDAQLLGLNRFHLLGNTQYLGFYRKASDFLFWGALVYNHRQRQHGAKYRRLSCKMKGRRSTGSESVHFSVLQQNPRALYPRPHANPLNSEAPILGRFDPFLRAPQILLGSFQRSHENILEGKTGGHITMFEETTVNDEKVFLYKKL